MDTRPIGVFDSGLGGLTAVRQLRRVLPGEDIVYFGDTGRVPYGSRGRETIIQYARQDIGFLLSKNVKFIVAACGTVSSTYPPAEAAHLPVPFTGVVGAAARCAAAATRTGRIGIIGTQATIRSGSYQALLRQLVPDAQLFAKACPLFVPLVEEGLTHDFITEEIARRYVKDLQYKDIDTLILGCTHYPLLRTLLRKVMGPGVTLVNPAYETAIELKELLRERGLARDERLDGQADYRFYVSDLADQFQEFAASILPYDIHQTEQIDIEEYGTLREETREESHDPEGKD